MAKFITPEWMETIKEKLNTDQHYAQVARNWEGDMVIQVDPGGTLKEPVKAYFDLWHGKCRDAYLLNETDQKKAVLALSGPYGNYERLIKGEMEPMQALLTRKLSVQGNMALIMRNVPTVLDFVRCCREITDSYL